MKARRAAVAAAIAAMFGSQVLAQQKTLSADVAMMIAEAAVQKCRADGIKVAAKVVDATNTEKAFLRDDGAPALTVDFAQAKINTVMLTGRPSGGPGGAVVPAQGLSPQKPTFGGVVGLDPASGKTTMGVEAGGAVPIKIGSDLVGAVGVSGAPKPEQDLACANAGLAKVADKLK
jgi:uncharacterized protein GlcG (DUF336 family)